MTDHVAEIAWRRETQSFAYEDYNRSHEWRFENGERIRASAAPAFLGDRDRIDPEEAFVASVASCHMLTLLAIAARKRLCVDGYVDRAVGRLSPGAGGRLWLSRVDLHPKINFAGGATPSRDVLEDLHALAHRECFIANSVKTEIVVSFE